MRGFSEKCVNRVLAVGFGGFVAVVAWISSMESEKFVGLQARKRGHLVEPAVGLKSMC